MVRLQLLLSALSVALSHQACVSDDDCSLNGVCSRTGACKCDPAWTGDDCGALDVRPAKRNGGYNMTAEGTSSWCSKIVQDPWDRGLHHLFASEFTHGCGLDYWAPYSRIIRAESRTGPAGPYRFAAEVMGAFAHNPTVVYSPADKEWLLYYIGCPTQVSDTCQSQSFTCGPGNDLNGESGVSVLSSRDLRHWDFKGQVMQGDNSTDWDADVTNPTAFPLYTSSSCGREASAAAAEHGHCPGHTDAMLLVYRGCPFNCGGSELINVAVSETGYKGPYTKIEPDPIFSDPNEDPFVWRDKRGNFHMLLHSLEPDGGFGWGPQVGRHAWARNYTGPWTFGNKTLAFGTEVQYDDGTTIDFFRRERPELFFSEDGEMTPLLLTTGVQERNSPMSYSIAVPLGDAGVRAQNQQY
ncbi:uncharacterized protein TRIREDRAFT_109392 [Trichoderma reesei QM6a]|jgi:hypothetical protein|uniref:Predicted protein n=2 Tax=Hypocrea jecorina TaxID=51453 RepID=G0RP40_HYPJQ|nr:uncharacterized protein TRIREDRAFT_109392 [Trichoderma reesei QM6a]EGR47125.1 predicted protein [Trichoderma reesei QM6a]ETR99650.1 hypothetical protein M419DRAFT_85180 [Trichoderma reesei RUT C-30]